jgi:mycothiol system anti-sigma-R factor
MIGCREAINQLWEYLDGTVAPEDRAQLEEHLARCRTCCGELEFARELRSFLAESRREDIPDEVMRRLNDALEELRP